MKWSVRPDLERNRLYVTLSGLFSDLDTQQVCAEIVAALPRLRPGFDVVNDISTFRPIAQSALAEVRRTAEAIAQAGVRRSVRIVGPSAIASMQLQRETREAGYVSFNVATAEEAEVVLAQP